MPTDKFGYPFIYPTKLTGGLGTGAPFFWQQSNDIRNDREIKGMVERSGGGGISDVNTSTGEFTANHESSDSWTINKDPSFSSSIGGNDMNFAHTEARGYGYKADQPRDIELTIIAKFLDARDDTGWSLSGPTGRHTTPEPGCQGFAYMFSIEHPNSSPQSFRFRKEMWHVNYDTDPKTGNFTHPSFNFSVTGINRYLGFKYIRYNKKDGRGAGKDSVIVEGWGNPNPDSNKNNWVLIKRTEDTGGWGDGGTSCGGSSTQVGTWSNAVFRIKASDMTIRCKHCSLREIDPTRSFDDVPAPPDPGPTDTTEIIGQFTLKRDINSLRTSTCEGSGSGGGGGGAGGSAIIYDSPFDSSGNDWKFRHGSEPQKIRIGMQAVTSSSTLCNKPPIKVVDLYLKKVGSPTGTATCKIRGNLGGVPTDKATIGTVDVTTLPTGTSSMFTFTNASNTYSMVTGDRLILEYTGGDASNYVAIKVSDELIITNGEYTKATYFDDTTDTWTQSSERELTARLWA